MNINKTNELLSNLLLKVSNNIFNIPKNKNISAQLKIKKGNKFLYKKFIVNFLIIFFLWFFQGLIL